RYRALEPGQVEGLARRHERDRPLGDFGIERRDGYVALTAEGQLAVDLVGHDREAAAQARLGQARQLRAREDAADRIVRAAEQEESRAVADGRRERVDVDLVAPVRPARQRGLRAREADAGGRAEDRWVDRRLEDEPVAGHRQDPSSHVEARNDPGDQHYRVRRHAPAVALQEPIGEQLVELRLLEGQVAEDAVLDPLAERADHGLRRLEVHVRHPERQDIGAVLLPLGAVGVPAVDETIEVVGHGGSSYHARTLAAVRSRRPSRGWGPSAEARIQTGGDPWQCESGSSGPELSEASSAACSPRPGTT